MERYRVADRMNRLPVSKFTIGVCACMFIGWMCEAIDLGMTSYMLPTLSKYWGMTPDVAGWYASTCFIGMLIGSLFGGPLADKVGRKPTIMVFMVVTAVANIGLAISPSLEILFVFRAILGIGLGVQFPVAVAYISESLPASQRGRYVALYQLFLPIGMAIAALLVTCLLNHIGWQGLYWICAIPGLWFIAVWKVCPESTMWLESKGRIKEADDIMTNVWEKHAITSLEAKGKGSELAPVVSTNPPQTGKVSIIDLFKGKQLPLTILAILFMFCAQQSDYGLTTWLTTLFVSKGYTVTTSTLFVLMGILGGIPGYFLSAWGVNKVGRKWACMIACVFSGVFGILYGFSNSEIMIVIVGFLYNMGKYAVAMCFLVYMPELFSTALRASGNGLSSAGGRFGSILGAPIMAFVMTTTGSPESTFIYAAVLVFIAAILVVILGPETRNKVF